LSSSEYIPFKWHLSVLHVECNQNILSGLKWIESTNLAREDTEKLKNVRKKRETKGKKPGRDSRTDSLFVF